MNSQVNYTCLKASDSRMSTAGAQAGPSPRTILSVTRVTESVGYRTITENLIPMSFLSVFPHCILPHSVK